MFHRIIELYIAASRQRILLVSTLLFTAVATIDLLIPQSLGFLYVLPIVFAAGFLTQSQVVLIAAISAGIRELLAPEPLESGRVLRALTTFGSFVASGLLVSELSRNQRAQVEHLRELREQILLREEAQEQLSVLIDTSPAAILIVDGAGKVLLANESAEQMFGFAEGTLTGASVFSHLPALETVPVGGGHRSLQSSLECRGQRLNGGVFLAQVWFSTYQTGSGSRVAAIVLDASEGLRDREGAGLESLMRTSRVLLGAVSHSVRNLCAASQVSYANLARLPELRDNEDLKALGTLIRGLESIARTQLVRAPDRPASIVDLHTLLDELRVVIEPTFEEAGVGLSWDVDRDLPAVIGEHYGLLHAFLNLTQNSERALANAKVKRLEIKAHLNSKGVDVSFIDTAGGVRSPETLFQPFHPGSTGSGLGLYVSRAIVQSFDGNLHYEPAPGGSRFCIELRTAYNRVSHATSDGKH